MGKDVIMINGVGAAGSVRVDVRQGEVLRGAASGRPAGVGSGGAPAVASLAATIAADGAPIDTAKVAMVKQAIAEGRYPVDPHKIAERMVALDLAGADA